MSDDRFVAASAADHLDRCPEHFDRSDWVVWDQRFNLPARNDDGYTMCFSSKAGAEIVATTLNRRRARRWY